MNDTEDSSTLDNVDEMNVAEIILTTIDIIVIIVITIGNTFTIAAVCRFRKLQNPSNVMIVFLSVCDLILGPGFTPIRIMYVTWPSLFDSKCLCMLIIFMAHFSGVCAIMGLSFLSLERAYAVQFPFHYHSFMTVRRAATSCALSLGFSFCINVPFIAGLGNWDTSGCNYSKIYPMAYMRSLIVLGLGVLFLGFAGFVRVVVAELRRRKQVVALEGQNESWEKNSHGRCGLMCVIYASSLFFWSPHMIYYLYDTITNPKQTVIVYRVMAIFDLVSSAINFFIYGFKNSQFRRAYKQLLGFDTSPVSTVTSRRTDEPIAILRDDISSNIPRS